MVVIFQVNASFHVSMYVETTVKIRSSQKYVFIIQTLYSRSALWT